MKIMLSEIQTKNTQHLIVITGAPRSGTSLLGRLIGTLAGIDYHYEPPMIWALSGLLSMKAVTPEIAKILLQVYIHEDLLCESVAGRKVNLRPDDESFVLGSMGWKELLNRWSVIKGRNDVLEYIRLNRITPAIKLPSIINMVPFIENSIQDSKIIVIIRDGFDVVRSIVNKRWFTDEGIEANYWPFKLHDGKKVPHIVKDSDASKWLTMNETTRACYLWRRDAEYALELKQCLSPYRFQLLSYEYLVEDPRKVVESVTDFLSVKMTDLTELAITSVNKRVSVNGGSREFPGFVEEDELEKFNVTLESFSYPRCRNTPKGVRVCSQSVDS